MRRPGRIWLALGLCCVVLAAGCWRPGAPEASQKGLVDWAAEIRPEGGTAGPPTLRRDVQVERRGVSRRSQVLVAPSIASLRLRGAAGLARLQGWAAPVFNIGDGFELTVHRLGEGGDELLYRRHYDAARRASDRDWIGLDLVIRFDQTGECRLRFELSGGPQGDLVADWLALASLHLIPAGEDE